MKQVNLAPPCRSVLYVPSDKPRALEKAPQLGCDAIIFDLEDSVAPDNKPDAREALRLHFKANPVASHQRIIRINSFETEWGTEDFLAARACQPDAILLPKVSSPDDLAVAADALSETDAPASLKLWAMIETARAILHIGDIAAFGGRLDAFVAGTNDLFKETGLSGPEAVQHAHPWLMQIVLAARACGLSAIDGVFGDFRDANGFERACCQSAAMGFDGKTLIHPSQVAAANAAFAPSGQDVLRAKSIVAAFDLPENANRGVIDLDGQMVERLHLDQAQALLARAHIIEQRESTRDPEGD